MSLQREIHNLQQAIHGEKVSTSPDAPGWGAKETADLVGRSKSSVVQDVKLAEAAEAFPELFDGCRTKHEASKMMNKLGESIVREELARRAESQLATGTKKQLIDSFIMRDFFEGIKDVPDGSIHLAEIDPPYGINLKKAKRDYAVGTIHDGYNEVDHDDYPQFLTKLFRECYRVMAANSWLICWFAPEPWFETVFATLKSAGFECSRLGGAWIKPTGQTKRPETNLANTMELFFYARKGKPTLSKPGRANTFIFPPVPAVKKTHPTERPLELIQEVLSTFAYAGSRVLVPFLGSGNTLVAAHSLGMSAFGFELTKQYKDSFIIRVNSLTVEDQ